MQGQSSEHQEQKHYSGAYYRYKCHEIFRPIIIEKFGDDFINLGQFNKKTHKEVKEAIRQNKAIYSTINQGVIIYNLDQQPDPAQWTEDEIKELLALLQEEYHTLKMTISQ
jgi:flagellar biosynthesis/type III secretory pathway ATPase